MADQLAVDVVGGGPAGSAAAIVALRRGARVRIFERTVGPRHKVCGEFLSPAVTAMLDRLGCAEAYRVAGPVPLRRLTIRFGSRVRRGVLPAHTYGLSRYALDHLLLQHAVQLGAGVERETRPVPDGRSPVVLACGRDRRAPPGRRLFGFKAHCRGRADDEVVLHFFDGCYVGVSAVEGGCINVCGLVPEHVFRACGFAPEAVMARGGPALAERLASLQPMFDWLITGPVVPGFVAPTTGGLIYPAGDALGFIDPFTGSGIANALVTGARAGRAAVDGRRPADHLAASRRLLRRPLAMSAAFRHAVDFGLAPLVAPVVPVEWLFRLTRPSLRDAPSET